MRTITTQYSSTLFSNRRSWRVRRKQFYNRVTNFLIVLKSFSLYKGQQDENKNTDNDIESQDEDDQGLGRIA